jgi:hypothetical protein
MHLGEFQIVLSIFSSMHMKPVDKHLDLFQDGTYRILFLEMVSKVK